MPDIRTHDPAQPAARLRPLLIVAVLVIALVTAAIIWHSDGAGDARPAMSSALHSADGVNTVDLEGISGTLSVGVSSSAQITATAQPVDGRTAPALALSWNSVTRTLALECPGPGNTVATTCPATSYAVLVPARVGVVVRLTSGQARIAGLTGPVSITAASADVAVQDLRAADFTAAITSGTLTASFAIAPTDTSVSVTSAQASLSFPSSVLYDVQEHSVSADIQVAIPQSAASAHVVTATATSGEISLGLEKLTG